MAEGYCLLTYSESKRAPHVPLQSVQPYSNDIYNFIEAKSRGLAGLHLELFSCVH